MNYKKTKNIPPKNKEKKAMEKKYTEITNLLLESEKETHWLYCSDKES